MDAANHCLAYLDTFRTLAIQYSDQSDQLRAESKPLRTDTGPKQAENEPKVFFCSSDAAFADNPDRKSSYRYLFKLYGGAIAWKASKQATVTTSSTEAELLALTTTAKEALW